MTLFDRYTNFVSNTTEKAWSWASPVIDPAWDAWRGWCADLGARLDQPWPVVMAGTVVAVLILWKIIGDYVMNIAGVALALGLLALAVSIIVWIISGIAAWIDAHMLGLGIAATLFLAVAVATAVLAASVMDAEDPWEEARIKLEELWDAAVSEVQAAAGFVANKVSARFGRTTGLTHAAQVPANQADPEDVQAAEGATLHDLFDNPPKGS